MYLKRIEMAGFKSFPDKIRLEFDKGITAVVGPNGSGKSNISDAVRWVLGEQSAKSLRGVKMEDVIFAGTANRRPLGFAEVSLIIDNADKQISVEYTEITITRRVYRSGESEYKLNGANCRLKDIHELFMDTGLGREGYSIIGQGRIEEILSSKGEDRRLLLEEAAGIVKYKTRRFEAISKLEKEKQNITRLNDIIDEIETQLDPLLKQSEKAKEYLKINEALKLIKINIFVSEIENSTESLNQIEENLDHIIHQIENEISNKEEIQLKIQQHNEKLNQIDNHITQSSQILVETRSEMEQCENDIILKEEQKQHIHSDIEFYQSDIEAKQLQLEQFKKELVQANEEYSKNLSHEKQKETLLIDKNKELEQFTHKMADSDRQIELYNIEIFEQVKKESELKSSFKQLQNFYTQLEEQKEILAEDEETTKNKLYQKDKELNQLLQEISGAAQNYQLAKKNIEILSDEKNNLFNDQNQITIKLNQCTKEIDHQEGRIKLLKELEKNFDGYYKSVKTIMQYKKDHPNQLKGIIGAVGSLIEVPEKYETAIEIALGQAVQNIVSLNENDAKDAIDYLKKVNAGRATFLPVSTIAPRYLGNIKNELMKTSGVLGIASDLVSFPGDYENIILNLLGRTIIVTDMNMAIAVAKKYKNAYKVVTLSGEVINAGGAITGGSLSQKSTGIFSRSREINALTGSLTSLKGEKTLLQNKQSSVLGQLEAISKQEEETRELLHSYEIKLVTLSQTKDQAEEDRRRYQNKIEQQAAENKQLMDQIMNINIELRTCEQNQSLAEEETKALKLQLNQYQQSIFSYRQEKDEMAAAITEIRVALSAVKQLISAISEKILRLKGSISDNEQSISTNESYIQAKNQEIIQRESEVLLLRDKIINLKLNQEKYSATLDESNLVRAQMQTELKTMDAQLQEKTAFISNLNNEQVRLEVKKEHIDTETARLYDEMWNEYAITYQQALKYEKILKPLSKLQSEEKQYKNQIRDLGSVNVGAIEEYKVLEERYAFLNKQKKDILDAEENLKNIIMKLTHLMEEQFHEHFKIISDNFSKVFAEMFGGGKAYLSLSDENNLLESGIDIIAQPVGKNLQNMSLLSGGERALTATALLFAILQMKPSPFCILDEVEAALDDANVVRYADYLKNISLDTQFILITHRKGVMEAADVLYGITMQEQGVSKLISVKFADETA